MMNKNVLGELLAEARGIESNASASDNDAADAVVSDGLQKCIDEADAIIEFLKDNLQIASTGLTVSGSGGHVK